LLARRLSGSPVIVDMDDDEAAMTEGGRHASLASKLRDPLGRWHTRLAISRLAAADGFFSVLAENQKKFGGALVPHGKDVETVDPARVNGAALRASLGFSEESFVIGFVGTPRPHKGIEDVLEAVARLSEPGIRVLVVGGLPQDPYVESLLANFSGLVTILPPQPLEKMPEFLSAVDAIVLAQRDTPAARGQVPAKLFDAMAMGKPIIATEVGDIPKVLSDCGILVKPDDRVALAEAIAFVRKNPPIAQELARKARARCIERFSFSNMRQAMNAEIEHALRRRKKNRPGSAVL
jgi:glycosyltransferase involved in cell wall biosynthesis